MRKLMKLFKQFQTTQNIWENDLKEKIKDVYKSYKKFARGNFKKI